MSKQNDNTQTRVYFTLARPTSKGDQISFQKKKKFIRGA